MFLYETLMLTVPEVTIDESKQLEKLFETMIQKHKGAKISFDRWGKYRLAQPVNKNNYGVYFLGRFEVDGAHKDALLAELDEYLKLKLSSVVMRFMTSVLNSKKSLEYTKPLPLDESVRSVDKFLKDNKMDSLISGNSTQEVDANVDADLDEDLMEEEN